MSDIALDERPLPTGSIGALANGYWGMIALVVTEAALFVYLEFSYYYAVQPHAGSWPPDGPPNIRLSLPNTLLLLASSFAVWWGQRGTKRGMRLQQTGALALGFLMGAAFVFVQGLEWENQKFSLSSGSYGSLFFITGFHMAHVVVGLLLLAAVTVRSFAGYFGPARSAPVSIAGDLLALCRCRVDHRVLHVLSHAAPWPHLACSAVMTDIAHPAARRHQARPGLLWAALFAVPCTWALRLVVNYGIDSHLCFPGETRRSLLPGWTLADVARHRSRDHRGRGRCRSDLLSLLAPRAG